MSDGKRYYWLKLKDDFFTSKRIKKLRNQAGGDTYTIIYLKMQLLAMKTDGVLTWTGLEENFAEELALDLDEKPDDVEITLLYLLKVGLAETQDQQHFFFPYAVENTGSEQASAKRVRDFRKRQTLQSNGEALQSNGEALQSNGDVTQVKRLCNGEKEIEIERRDRDREKSLTVSKETVCRTKDVRRIVEAWNRLGLNEVREVTGESKRGGMLRARVKEHGVDGVLEAIENVRKSDFLKGQNAKGFVITFDWFVKPNNFIKVLEGNYNDLHEPDTSQGKGQKPKQYTTAENYQAPKAPDTLQDLWDKVNRI